jgi:hypothetical protein
MFCPTKEPIPVVNSSDQSTVIGGGREPCVGVGVGDGVGLGVGVGEGVGDGVGDAAGVGDGLSVGQASVTAAGGPVMTRLCPQVILACAPGGRATVTLSVVMAAAATSTEEARPRARAAAMNFTRRHSSA